MASLDGAAGVSGQQWLQQQIEELSVRQARSARLSSQKFDLMTSVLHGLLDRVDRITGVGAVEEDAGSSVVATAVGAARDGDRLHFQERGLPSCNDDGVGFTHSRTAPLPQHQSPLVLPREASARGDFRTAELRHQRSRLPVDVGSQTDRPERRDEHRVYYPAGESQFLDDRPDGSVGSGRGTGVAMGVRSFRPHLPQFSGKPQDFPMFQKDAVNFAKTYGYDEAILGGLHVPVGDHNRTFNSLLHEGYTREQVKTHHAAWQFFCSALKGADLDLMYGLTSPREVWERLEERHVPQTHGGRQELYERFTEFKMTVDENPVNVLIRLEELAELLTKSGITMSESHVFARFASLLPSEYGWQKEYLHQRAKLSREDILRGVREKFFFIQTARKKAKAARREAASGKRKSGNNQAFVVDSSDNNGGRADGLGKSRGGSAGEKKAANSKSSTTPKTVSSTKSTTATMKCTNCLAKGHLPTICPKQRCGVCEGKGHNAEVCPNVLTMVMACEVISDSR